MSARSIWKGSLSVSLLNIPVKLYKATDDKGKATSCRTLHTTCNHPINEKTICAHCNVDVPATDTVKGFPNADGTFTVLTTDDINGIKSPTSDALLVESFVPLADVSDPIWVEQTYFLSPDGKAATKAFATIRQGMIDTDRGAQALITLQGREQSVVVVPTEQGLSVRVMRSKALVRDASELPAAFDPKTVVDAAERALAIQVINTNTAPFDPTDYEDGYVTAFKAMVESKRTGVPVTSAAVQAIQTAGVDLMAALKASLSATKAVSNRKAVATVAKGKSSKKAKAS